MHIPRGRVAVQPRRRSARRSSSSRPDGAVRPARQRRCWRSRSSSALLALLVWRVSHDSDKGVSQALDDGEQPTAPAFDLKRLDGRGRIDLASLRGKKPIVLDFWASWCVPCIHESKRLEAARKRYGDRVEFIGVDTKDFSGEARALAAQARDHVSERPRRQRRRAREVGRAADSADLLRRSQREGRRRAGRGGRPAAVPAADRRVVMRSPPRLRRRSCSRCPSRARASGIRRCNGARGRGDVPRLRDDARPVELAGGAADQARDRAPHRRGRHEERDQGPAGRRVRRDDPRRAAAQGLRPAGVVAADRRNRRRRRCSSALGAWRWSRAREPCGAGPSARSGARSSGWTTSSVASRPDGEGRRTLPRGLRVDRVPVRAAARAGLPVGGLGSRGAATRRPRRRAARRAREPAVHPGFAVVFVALGAAANLICRGRERSRRAGARRLHPRRRGARVHGTAAVDGPARRRGADPGRAPARVARAPRRRVRHLRRAVRRPVPRHGVRRREQLVERSSAARRGSPRIRRARRLPSCSSPSSSCAGWRSSAGCATTTACSRSSAG